MNEINNNNQTYEAESMILGAVFLEPDIIHEIILEPDHFYSVKNKLIFKAIRELVARNIKTDISVVAEQLKDSLESAGGISYLTEIAVACPSTENIDAYQTIVLEKYKMRTLIANAANFLNERSDEAADHFYKTYVEMQELGVRNGNSKQDVLMEIHSDMIEDKGEMTGIDTGFTDLNNMTGGLSGGDLIIVAARPSMGKTAFALNLAKRCCEKGGVADIFSLEMPEKQLTQRILSSMMNIEGAKWRNPYRMFNDEDRKKATSAIGKYSNWYINIHDSSQQTIADIRARVRKTQREHPDKNHIVVIDYLQLITHVGKFDRHDLAIGDITRQLKQMARQFDVPVVLLSQLSRAVEQRQDKRPMMSDLRDSGSIEQDADLIMFLYREDYYDRESKNKNVVEINLAKQRNGPVGTIQLAFVKEYSQFVNLERRWEEAQ